MSTGRGFAWVRGDPDLTYTLHRGDLPTFHALALDPQGSPSGHVHSIGYGKVSAFPRLHRSEGTVSRTERASDGTPIIRLDMTQPIQDGDSGAPLFDEHEHVVGIITWTVEREQLPEGRAGSGGRAVLWEVIERA